MVACDPKRRIDPKLKDEDIKEVPNIKKEDSRTRMLGEKERFELGSLTKADSKKKRREG